MSEKLNVVIEKSESGYLAFCPELSESKFENNSFQQGLALSFYFKINDG